MNINKIILPRLLSLAILIVLQFNIAKGINKEKEIIVIETRNTTMVLSIDNDKVSSNYYGAKLVNTDDYKKKNIVSLGDFFPSYAGKSYFENPLRVTHSNGVLSTELKYMEHKLSKVDDNSQFLKIKLKEITLPFYTTICIKTYYNEDIVETWCEYQNDESKPVVLESFASAYLPLKAGKYFLTKFYGSWLSEMNMEEGEIQMGMNTLQSTHGIRATHILNPSFIVSLNRPSTEEEGEVIGGSLAWSGSWKITFEKDREERLNIIAGINNFASSWTLKTGEVFQTPRLLYTFSKSGKGLMSRNFHAWARKYGIQDGKELRPVVLNSWEGNFFDFDEGKMTTMIKNGAEMGIEMFVLDDGWFGSDKYPRDNDKLGLGDWDVNKKRFPRGLEPVIEEAKKQKVKMGIWVEPEMVNPKSELFEKHPDWALQEPDRAFHPERNQYVLDLTNPQVKTFVYNTVHDVLKKYPYITYVKWDCNSSVTNPGSTYLSRESQEQFWIKYIQNFYAICDSLIKAHPEVMFQVCASGGGRVEYGSLPYFHEFWASDNTDALQRIFIQHGTSYFFPAMAIAAHVSKSHVTSLKFRFDVAMSARMGIELLPADLNAEDLKFAKSAVETYKGIRPIIQFGDLYRLSSPYESSLTSLMYVDELKSKAVVFTYLTRRLFGDFFPNIRLRGLDANKKYKISEINLAKESKSKFTTEESVFSGEFLMAHGIQCVNWGKKGSLSVDITSEFPSAVFLIEALP